MTRTAVPPPAGAPPRTGTPPDTRPAGAPPGTVRPRNTPTDTRPAGAPPDTVRPRDTPTDAAAWSGAVAVPAPRAPEPAEAAPGPRLRRLRYEPLTGECLAAPTRPYGTTAAEPAPARSRPPRAPARTPTRPASNASSTDSTDSTDSVRDATELALLLVLDVLDGRRPAWQLTAHLTAEAVRCVRAAAPRGSGRSRLTSLRICRPAPAAAEVAAVYRLDGRARAVAARFEPSPGRGWRCVAIRLG